MSEALVAKLEEQAAEATNGDGSANGTADAGEEEPVENGTPGEGEGEEEDDEEESEDDVRAFLLFVAKGAETVSCRILRSSWSRKLGLWTSGTS